jgi:hypothetical protein
LKLKREQFFEKKRLMKELNLIEGKQTDIEIENPEEDEELKMIEQIIEERKKINEKVYQPTTSELIIEEEPKPIQEIEAEIKEI